jgi:hypothetical protein
MRGMACFAAFDEGHHEENRFHGDLASVSSLPRFRVQPA